MNRPSPSAPDELAPGSDSDSKNAEGGIAPTATVTWGQQDRIFAFTETTDAQLGRVREKCVCVCVHGRTYMWSLLWRCGNISDKPPARSWLWK